MDEDASTPPPPPAPPPPLEYRPPGAEAKSQWWTDDQPGRHWVIGCLLVLTFGGAVLGVVFGVVSLFLGC